MSKSPQVPLLDLSLQYEPLREQILAAITSVCDSQHFVLGAEVAALEQEIAEYSGAAFGVGVSSGTDALLLALMALGIGPGDEVIITPFTFFATAGVVVRLGARPIFCDIEPDSCNLNVDAVAEFLKTQCTREKAGLTNRNTGGRVRVIMPVHLYGQCADMEAVSALASEYDLAIVEDAAQAIGAETSQGLRAGSVGHIGCFSFFPTKNLGAFGDAGLCVTSDPELAEKLKVLRVHGGQPKYYHSHVGGNFRLDELQAAVLRVKLKSLDDWTTGRQANAARYTSKFSDAGLGDVLTFPGLPQSGRHIFNQYVIRTPDRDRLRKYLTEQGIGTEIYYPLSLHQQSCFKSLGYTDQALPEATSAAREVIALPIFGELTKSQVDYVAESVEAFFRSV